MQYDREVEFDRSGVERLELGVVERHAGWRIHHQPPGPTLARAAADLGERSLDISGARENYTAEPLREGPAVIAHPAVIAAVHSHFELDVVARGPGAEPARGQGQIDIDPLEIHVGEPCRRISVDPRRGIAFAGHTGESGHVATGTLLGLRRAEPAVIAALAPCISHLSVASDRPIRLPDGEPLLLRLAEIAGKNLGIGTDMGVGIEDPVSVASHHSLRYFCCAASGR